MNDFAEALRKQYGADEWLRPEPRDVNVFTWKFKPFAIDDLTPERMQFFDTPPNYQLPLEQAQRRPVRTTESTFLSEKAMLVLTTYECDSRAEARAHLLRLLGDFQGPVLERADAAGEVSYAVPHGISAVAARGNLVLYARNGGEDLTDVTPLLRRIDERLTRENDFREELDARVEGSALRIARPNADEWVHILARGGEVQAGEEGLRFVRSGEGPARLSIARIAAGRVAGRVIEVE